MYGHQDHKGLEHLHRHQEADGSQISLQCCQVFTAQEPLHILPILALSLWRGFSLEPCLLSQEEAENLQMSLPAFISAVVVVQSCMFMIKLPQYSSLEIMLEKLRCAIHYREDPLSG